MRQIIPLLLCLFCLTGQSREAPTSQATTVTATRSLTFAQMGQPAGLRLNGTQKTAELNAGVRLDELVTRVSLNLRVLYPQGMRHDQSFIRVYVNNQLSGISQLSAARAGVPHTVSLELDPLLLSDFASIRVEYDGTYDSECINPDNPTIRLDVLPDSSLTLTSTPVNLVNDLALLPAPFFDPRDSRKLKLPLVLPSRPSETSLKAAGILASWMGVQAFYRQTEFELLEKPSTARHTIVMSTGSQLPPGMKATEIEGPMLLMTSAPEAPWVKHLYVLGRTDEELLRAVHGLVIEGQVLSGQKAIIRKVDLGAPRRPYDAPRYVPTSRPVRLGELVDFTGQLEVSAGKPRTAVSLRLPPDLFSWAGRNIPMELKYRYTAPSRWNDSVLNVEINNSLIQSFRLAPRSEQGENKVNISLLGNTELGNQETLQIPAFKVGGNNELAFSFGFAPEGGYSRCTPNSQFARGSIDPGSTLDFSSLPHYIRMPNLTAFANGGYPFSIMADHSDTVMVLPSVPSMAETKAYLNLMGLFGQWTGLPAIRTSLIMADQPNNIGGRNWLALGTSDKLAWLNEPEMNLPLVLNATERSMGLPTGLNWLQGLWQSDDEVRPSNDARALVQTAGPLGAIMGFESHLEAGKAGVVITGTDEESLVRAAAALSSYADVAKIKGSVSLIRGNEILSYNQGETYISGALPWWLRLRIAFSEYPALIAVGGALAGVVLALLAFGWLSRRSSSRMGGS